MRWNENDLFIFVLEFGIFLSCFEREKYKLFKKVTV